MSDEREGQDDEDVKKASVEPAPKVEEEDFPDEGDLPEGDDGVVIDDIDLKDALRGALRPPPGTVAPNLLRGVQRKLRVRSRGKFYGDGWSNATSPRSTYLITSAIMLLLIAIVLFALLPFGSASLP